MSLDRKSQRTLERWLHYESTGEEARAEKALAEFMGDLPAATAPAGFADRVLRASGVSLMAASSRSLGAAQGRGLRAPEWVWQTAFGFWLVSGFLAALAAGGFAVDLARSGRAVDLGARLVVALGRLGADVLTILGGLLRAGSAISTAFSGPGVLALVLACALASLAALGALKPLLTSERSRHVESY